MRPARAWGSATPARRRPKLFGHDPIHKLLLDRDPLTGGALGSQPTLSRFENSLRRGDLFAMAEALADTVIATQQARRAGQRVRRITLDLDTTEDPTHAEVSPARSSRGRTS